MKERVVVAMSGGVDSSTAAALLKNQGYEVVGITMCFSAAGGSAYGGNLSEIPSKKPRCCGLQGIEDAKAVAHQLGIKHYVLNMQKVMQQYVIKDFCREYLLGRTPNPCIRCNQYVKFGALLKKALSLDAKYLATGHYARIIRAPSYFLKKAKDLHKDQSYFLYRLNQAQLKHTLFPLGNYTKSQVRGLARKFNLTVAEKQESQEICFLPDTDYRGFLKQDGAGKIKIKPGLVVDTKGQVLGSHKGVAFYTIGQREGLGIAMGYPVYVVKIDPRRNQLIVGSKVEAYKQDFFVKSAHFASGLKKKIALKVKIRYNHPEAVAEVSPQKGKIRVHFLKPQFAITPGQSAVFYEKDKVLGGGIITEVGAEASTNNGHIG